MDITIQYTGQLSGITGASEETVQIDKGTTLDQLIARLVDKYKEDFRDLLLTEAGNLRPSLLVIFDGEQVTGSPEEAKLDGVETVLLMTPIAGG